MLYRVHHNFGTKPQSYIIKYRCVILNCPLEKWNKKVIRIKLKGELWIWYLLSLNLTKTFRNLTHKLHIFSWKLLISGPHKKLALCKGPANDYSRKVWVESNFQFLRKNNYMYMYSFSNKILGNQCLSQLKLWVWIPLMVRCTRYNIMLISLSVTYDRSVVLSGYSGFLQ